MPHEGCIFCRIIRKEIPAKIAGESDGAFAFHDVNPKAPVHILIIPKTHIESVNDLDTDLAVVLSEMTLMAKKLAKQNQIDASGFRLVMNTGRDAGQSVFHLHMHLLGGRMMEWPPG
jgi:histidine triad (HIT) family protein